MPNDENTVKKTEKIILERPEWRATVVVNVVEKGPENSDENRIGSESQTDTNSRSETEAV